MAINVKDYPNKVKTNLWANDKHTVFFYNFKHESNRYRGLIDLSDKAAWGKRDRVSYAEAELTKIKLERREGILNRKTSLDDFLTKEYEHLEDTDWNKRLKSHYDRYVSPLIGKKPVRDVMETHIKEAITHQRGLGLSPRTTKQTIEVLAPVFKAAISNRVRLDNPLDGISIKLPKTKKIVTNASEELARIYQAITVEFKDDPFYQSLYLFALQGRRKGEILSLKWADIDLDKDYYVIRDTKNGEEQKIFLPLEIKELLLQFKIDTEYVYISRVTGTRLINIRKTTDKLKKKLGDGFTLHYLRNVIVSAMAEQGLEAIHLSGALGHKSAKTIDKYLTLNYLRGSQLASDVISDLVKKKKSD